MNLENSYIVIAGEEAGPKSNKMGGIWNVIEAEAHTLAKLFDSGAIPGDSRPEILIVGPYYGHRGADWNKGLNRVTVMDGFGSLTLDGNLEAALKAVANAGIEALTGEKKVGSIRIGYILFRTDNFGRIRTQYNNVETTLENKVKAEAYALLGLDSMTYERMGNGPEYTHYLSFSYAVSEFIRALVVSKQNIEGLSQIPPASVLPCTAVCLHCHEFGVFYTIPRLKKLGVPAKAVATLHATLPGRTAGHNTIQKIRDNDPTWPPGVPANLATLEAMASYADLVTAVGESTRQEARLFYGLNGIVVRNGITIESTKIDWEKKEHSLENIQKFLSDTLYRYYGGKQIEAEKIIPVFTISRIEIENKGYPDLLDALVALDHIVENRILEGHLEENIKVVCFLVTAEGPKTNLPEGFPIHLPKEVLVGNELRIQHMIEERGLDCSELVHSKRSVAAVLYPQIISSHDGGLCMEVEDFMAGCCAGIFPSRYDPFLLTGLEAGREATPSVVSKVCGFSDAIKTIESLIEGLGGIIVVDNIDLNYYEAVLDYALALSYFIRNFVDDRVKYKLLCREAFLLAKDMSWEKPTENYYELITGTRVCKPKIPEGNESG